ncbi:MAG: FtsX-like permease family protein, partial [Vicinamibacteria bacterium]
FSTRLPFSDSRWSSDFTTEGWPRERFGIDVRHDEVSPGLFRTMGVPLLRGRDFDLGDDLDAPFVVIVNQALADRYFAYEDPIGKRICFDRVPEEDSVWRTIVGIVGNVRRKSLGLEEVPSIYAPVLQDTTEQVHLLIRGGGKDMAALVEDARDRLRALDPALPLFEVTTLEEVVASSVERERFLLALLAAAAAVALALAAIGIFGVVLYSTTRRVREIGIRVALGARGGSVVALVLGGGMRPVLVGIAAGLAIAVALAKAMSNLLFEVEPLDPITFLGVVALVLGAALAACLLPARWASRVDATAALRSE